MKIRVLIKENFNKIYNILPLIEKNGNLAKNTKTVISYNDENWQKIFMSTTKDLVNKKIDRILVFDDYGFLPFIFFSKQKNIAACNPSVREIATLARTHNNSNTCIIGLKDTPAKAIDEIISSFLSNDFEGGRHKTRVDLMHKSFKPTRKAISFNPKSKTIVIASDHAGYDFKLDVIKYLKSKKYEVIDVGTHSHDSCHYPLYGFALANSSSKAFCGIAICGTGLGISNTVNKFAGIKSCVCISSDQAKIARSTFGINVLSLGARFMTLKQALPIVNSYLKTKPKTLPQYKVLDTLGFQLDQKKVQKIK